MVSQGAPRPALGLVRDTFRSWSAWPSRSRNPGRMRFWDGGDPPVWTDSTTRTPRKIKDAWVKRHRE